VNVFKTSTSEPYQRQPTAVKIGVSHWAGQTVRLRLAVTDNRGPLRVGVDNIRFEPIGSEADARIELPDTKEPSRALDLVLDRLTEADALKALSARAEKLAGEGEFAGAVLVAKDDHVLFSHAYGLADRERGIPNTLRTRYRIGSMNKMFTAVAILQLADAVKLDVTSPEDAETAVQAAVDRFGGIDVLVNNAANFYAGYFEELTPEQMERQLTTSLIGPMNVTRAVLPVMRKHRSGHVVTISSSVGLSSFEYGTAYAASKFGAEGWMESLAPEVEPFGIHTTIVNPGFFRTELLTKESTNYATPSIEDYAERNTAQRDWWEAQNGKQQGDPAKLAQALLTIADETQPPRRFIAGADAIDTAEQQIAALQQQIDAYRELSSSLAIDEVAVAS
jgi:NAD(P)-dependent dehydrogenase (short-subunit alcohol dehydrogenase family)